MMEEAIHDSLSLENDYSIIGDDECIDALPHEQQSHYAGGRENLGPSNVLLPLPLPLPHIASVSPRALGDSSYTGAHSNSPESTSSEIASTGARHPNSLSFSSFQSHPTVLYPDVGPSNAYTSQIFSGSYQVQPHHSRSLLSTLPEISASSILSPTRSLALNSHSISPSASSTPRDTYSPGGLSLHRLSNSRSSVDNPRSFADCRPILAPHQTMSYLPNPAYASSPPFSHNPRPPNDETPSFHPVVEYAQLKLDDGTIVKPDILCKIEKGFFQSADGSWTCYRRNYFSVMLQYSLAGTYPQAPLYLTRPEGRSSSSRPERTITEQVKALGVCLSAAVDGPNGKAVELIQHTPKRDKGPQSQVRVAKILPMPAARVHRQNSDIHGYSSSNYGVSPATSNVVQDPPLLPLQNAADSHSSDVPTATSHTFERIQFKNATANNGKRRAQQQYYHLKAELFADVRQDGSLSPLWVKVAHRVSNPVVVRGRSPSHYKNEGPTSQSRGTASGIGSRSANQWPALRNLGPPGGPTTYSSYGHASYQPPTYTTGSSLARFQSTSHDGASYGMSSSTDHSASAQYLMTLSDSSSMGGSRGLMNSPSSGAMMSNTVQERVSEEDSGPGGYGYYPASLMDAGLANPKMAVKKEDHGRQQNSSSGQLENSCRMVGLETSRGMYSWGGG